MDGLEKGEGASRLPDVKKDAVSGLAGFKWKDMNADSRSFDMSSTTTVMSSGRKTGSG